MIPAVPQKECSLISLDLANNQAAIDLAEKIAVETGRTVTVRNEDGVVITTVTAPTKN